MEAVKTKYEGIYCRLLKGGRKVYYVRIRTGSGRTWLAAGFRLADAITMQGRLRIDRMEGRAGIRRCKSASFAALAEQYVTRYRSSAKPRNWPHVNSVFKGFIRHFGELSAGELTPQRIDGYVQARLAAKMNPRSVNSELIYLRAALNMAVEYGYLERAPKIRMLPTGASRPRIITADELAVIMPQVSPDHAAAIGIALDTGMRLGEIFRIRRTDLLENDVLHVVETKSGSPREIPLTPRAKETIIRQLLANGGVMFKDPSEQRLANRFTRDRGRIRGVARWRFHDLRHNFATELIRSGVDLYTAMQLTGHSNPRTLAIYLHSDLDRKRDAIETVQAGRKRA